MNTLSFYHINYLTNNISEIRGICLISGSDLELWYTQKVFK
jgi:hypothetical protein